MEPTDSYTNHGSIVEYKGQWYAFYHNSKLSSDVGVFNDWTRSICVDKLYYNPDGTIQLQIVEQSQLDKNNPTIQAMYKTGTHFNPVDLVCALKMPDGQKYNLPDYVDKHTGFISKKSKDGQELKALELPGLWNGSMSDWNTVFVEVPIETFNPVKTVNDLLREQHQP
jgi:hypothetical protein